MTKKELSQLYHLKKEIEQLTYRLQEVKTKTTTNQVLTGMPFVGGTSDKTGLTATEIAYIESLIAIRKRECELEYIRLLEYINTIEDSFTRQIFSYRFLNGFNWQQVANRIGNNTADTMRMTVNRYLQKK